MSSSPNNSRIGSGRDESLSANQNPFLFVVGCPRSGTTLLQRMLDHHPQLAVANDTHFIPRAIEKNFPTAMKELIQGNALPLTSQLVEGVREYHRFSRLGLSDDDVAQAASSSATYQEFVGTLYTLYGNQHGKRLAGEKTPDYVRHLPLLHGMFPNSKTVHIIRDGRDVALSLLDWAHENKGPGKFELWQEQPVAVSALWWRWQVESGRRTGARLGSSRYLEIRYEHLVSRSEETLHEVADFLELPFSHHMLSYHEGKARADSGLSAKKAWLPPTAGLRSWKDQMSDRDLCLFDELAGDVLAELEFESSDQTASAEMKETAQQALHWWNKTMARKFAKDKARLDLFVDARQSQSA